MEQHAEVSIPIGNPEGWFPLLMMAAGTCMTYGRIDDRALTSLQLMIDAVANFMRASKENLDDLNPAAQSAFEASREAFKKMRKLIRSLRLIGDVAQRGTVARQAWEDYSRALAPHTDVAVEGLSRVMSKTDTAKVGDTLGCFERYFMDRLERDPEFKARVLGLAGKALGCFCKPKPCHGDVIAAWVYRQIDMSGARQGTLKL